MIMERKRKYMLKERQLEGFWSSKQNGKYSNDHKRCYKIFGTFTKWPVTKFMCMHVMNNTQ